MKRIAKEEKSKRLSAEKRILSLESELKAIQYYGAMPRPSNYPAVFASTIPQNNLANVAHERVSIESVEVPAYLLQWITLSYHTKTQYRDIFFFCLIYLQSSSCSPTIVALNPWQSTIQRDDRSRICLHCVQFPVKNISKSVVRALFFRFWLSKK